MSRSKKYFFNIWFKILNNSHKCRTKIGVSVTFSMRLRPKRGRKAKPKYARLDAGQTDDIKRPYRLGTPLVTSLYWKSFKGKKITSVVRFQTSCCPDWATSIRVICDEGPEIINERKTQPLPVQRKYLRSLEESNFRPYGLSTQTKSYINFLFVCF